MRALALLALLAAACGHAPDRWNASCLARRGCAKPAVPAACPADVAPLGLEEVLVRVRELDGQRVAVRGPLVTEGGTCTLLGCYTVASVDTQPGGLGWRYRAPEPGKPHGMATLDDETFAGDRLLLAEGGCCNRCSAALTLGGAIWLSGRQLSCSGDESRLCCSVEARGQEVVARGRLHGATLDDAALCTLPRR